MLKAFVLRSLRRYATTRVGRYLSPRAERTIDLNVVSLPARDPGQTEAPVFR